MQSNPKYSFRRTRLFLRVDDFDASRLIPRMLGVRPASVVQSGDEREDGADLAVGAEGVAVGTNDVGERIRAGVVVVQGEESALAIFGEAFDDSAEVFLESRWVVEGGCCEEWRFAEDQVALFDRPGGD